jgi:acyl-CoA synthetase (AMP-forming)/AMP-acid ligase II
MMLDFDVRDEECRYSAAPMFHISGMALILLGVARGFPNVLYHQFEPDRVLDWLHEGRLTGCFLVPTMITTLVEHPRAAQGNYDALHGILYGAAPMSPTLIRRAMDIFKSDFIQAFGAGTEACLQTVLSAADHRRAASGAEHLLGSIGRPALGVELRLCDDHLNDVPRGEVGEIVTRSESVMSGYLRNPEATADSLVDGWFRAGDMAYMDDDGFLYLAGRKTDMIIRGGENIYPIEVETVLAEHPAVLESAVIGVPDEHWGEIVRAYVSVRRGMDAPTDDGLRAHCRGKLAGYKVPAEFVVVDELPRNASGKILKRELRLS